MCQDEEDHPGLGHENPEANFQLGIGMCWSGAEKFWQVYKRNAQKGTDQYSDLNVNQRQGALLSHGAGLLPFQERLKFLCQYPVLGGEQKEVNVQKTNPTSDQYEQNAELLHFFFVIINIFCLVCTNSQGVVFDILYSYLGPCEQNTPVERRESNQDAARK